MSRQDVSDTYRDTDNHGHVESAICTPRGVRYLSTHDYPAHDFVVDLEELEDLGFPARRAAGGEAQAVEELAQGLRTLSVGRPADEAEEAGPSLIEFLAPAQNGGTAPGGPPGEGIPPRREVMTRAMAGATERDVQPPESGMGGRHRQRPQAGAASHGGQRGRHGPSRGHLAGRKRRSSPGSVR